MSRVPPVTRLAFAFMVGAAWVSAGAPAALAPIAALAFLLLPNETSRLPGSRLLWLVVAGSGLAAAKLAAPPPTCGPVDEGRPVAFGGRFLAAPRGGSGSFLPEGGCGVVTVVLADSSAPPAGRMLRLVGSWREGRNRAWFLAEKVEPKGGETNDETWRWRTIRWRDGLVGRLGRLYGDDAPLIAALTLARREGLDTETRETFARVGIAHLLAISGFHVGVVAGLALASLRLLALSKRQRALVAAAAAWLYVAFIGFPDAACRAALMLTLVALSKVRGRPTAGWGVLGAALLILLVVDPRRLATPGFQLSFAGAAGLVAWSGHLSAMMRKLSRRRCPDDLASGLAAGIAATAATFPIVAWHFERISLVGIPVTLAAAPLVALALVGALASLALDFVAPGLGAFLAGGVTVVVSLLERAAGMVARWPWASLWTTKNSVIAGTLGVLAATRLARQPRIQARTRRVMTALYALAAVLSWPLLLGLQRHNSAEVLMIDVGQGDAIALRSPGGRWVLVDAGPAGRGGDPGGLRVVRALRARGVRRLEALILTHPDLDHIGGAAAVLSLFDVGAVYDPALAAPKEAFVDVLNSAAARGIPWRAARAGDRLELDGLVLDVLHPTDSLSLEDETNATSVVVRASYGDFDALLTGDAYKDVERALVASVGDDLEVLKVGHHGSDTSTDSLLLAEAHPEVALVSVGRRNRYGHPSSSVLRRLKRSGAMVHRTDREGTISVLGRRDGTYSVISERRGSVQNKR